jgi:tRNA-Thr(GGU) m(6)t(6)A37 methyltransferase TsaA
MSIKESVTSIAMPVIGTIHSPFTDLKNMPIQPPGAQGVSGKLIIKDEYAEGLKDLDGFSHIYIFYHFHKTTKTKLEVIPFMDKVPRGVFSTRTPMRPSRLGMSVIEVVSVDGNCVNVKGIDVLDGTPLIDIKPYILKFDYRADATSGWMQGSTDDVSNRRSDDRFI